MAENKEKRYVSDNAQLMAEWNWEKNAQLGLNPCCVAQQSNKKAWWRCKEGHEWSAVIANRTKGHGCPYCSGLRPIIGVNDFKTVNSVVANEWNYGKNGDLKPENFTANSGIKVWWKCQKGHEWRASIKDRNYGRRCPYCSGRYAIIGETDLKTTNPNLANEWNYEKNANQRPEDFTANSGMKVWWKCQRGHEWQATIAHRNRGRGCPTCSSERKKSFPEYALVYYLKKYGLDVVHSYNENGYELDVYIPSIRTAIEYDGYFWHKNKSTEDLEKNKKALKDGIRLFRIREGLLPLNDSSIDFPVRKNQKDLAKAFTDLFIELTGTTIDIDIRRDALEIENLREYSEKETSLLSSNPNASAEWNYKRNGHLRPEMFLPNSNKKVWWRCDKGHEWQATISNKNKGFGCPYCSGQRAIIGVNDLQTTNPSLSKEWNYEKNSGLNPEEILPSSNKKVWWKCSSCGYEWQATVNHRSSGRGCPECATKKRGMAYSQAMLLKNGSLKDRFPDIAAQWHPTKNGETLPNMVTCSTRNAFWWKCAICGCEWMARVVKRTSGTGCPQCAREKRKKMK